MFVILVCCLFVVFGEHSVCVFHVCHVFGLSLPYVFQGLLRVVGAFAVCFVGAFEVVLLAAGLALPPLLSDHLPPQPLRRSRRSRLQRLTGRAERVGC